MADLHEQLFYEVAWRNFAQSLPHPLPWWLTSSLKHWVDFYDQGLFSSKEASLASNAYYRYWHMVGEPDQDGESLVGQAGEVEPVYDEYAVSFFLYRPNSRTLHFPQMAGADAAPSHLTQRLEDGWKPIVVTEYESGTGASVASRVYATRIAETDGRTWIRMRLSAQASSAEPHWLGIWVGYVGPSGFQRHDKAGRLRADRRLGFLRYIASEKRVEVNATWGPSFSIAPASFGTYGNGGEHNPDFYLQNNPFAELVRRGSLNGWESANDWMAGLCQGAFLWPISQEPLHLDVGLPIGDFRNIGDLGLMAAPTVAVEDDGQAWEERLFHSGMRLQLPAGLRLLENQWGISRSHLLILADHGQIHPGPTIYESFWVRDSSVEGMALAMAGDEDLAERQFGTHYKAIFNRGPERLGPVSLDGFFGGEHEKNDREWDSNGQALWAFGRFDRIKGPDFAFGAGVFDPYVLQGARWLRDNRSAFGLLHSGWSAEHLGDKDKPHYWDDYWAIAGLWEAAQLAERIGAPAERKAELWSIYDELVRATSDSIRWVLEQQRQRGFWETFIPTGPADIGRLDSTVVGAVAYFHPCRLYMGSKLGADIDQAMRWTLDTLAAHFVDGGFRHDSAWNAYGPYLTLQLAHAFLLIGDVEKMAALLSWSVSKAGYASTPRGNEASAQHWQVALGAWNEQHCYPVASHFSSIPSRPWYMGDIPHGWACAELLLLLRDMAFFEADEERQPHLYLLPGFLPQWLGEGESVSVKKARTFFGTPLSFTATHQKTAKKLVISIDDWSRSDIAFVLPFRFGVAIRATADGAPLQQLGFELRFPGAARQLSIEYR